MTDIPPKVSVVCAWYNRPDVISDTIESLFSQDFDSFEIVVVNDGSTDPKVKEILDNYGDPRLKVIHQDNAGFVNAIKIAINAARADLIAIHGAGDISSPLRLKAQYKYMIENKSVCCVGFNRKNKIVGGLRDGEVEIIRPSKRIYTNKDILNENPVTHGDVMFWRSIYNKAGGYRPAFTAAQDLDLWLRMSEYGNIAVIDKQYYERRVFLSDGFDGNDRKSIVQREFIEFARDCAKARLQFGFDAIDIFGDDAIFFRKPSRSMSVFYSSKVLQYIANNDFESAELLHDLMFREKMTAHSFFATIVFRLQNRVKFVRPVLRPFFVANFTRRHKKDHTLGYRSLVKKNDEQPLSADAVR